MKTLVAALKEGMKFSIGQKLAKQYLVGWGPRRRNPGSTTGLY